MNPLRVLHVTPYSGDAWGYGGIPRIVEMLASGLARNGHAVTVCTTDAADATSRLHGAHRHIGAWQADTRSDGVKVHVFPNVSNRLAYHAQMFLPLGLGAFLRSHRHEFDVAHLHACRNLPGVIAGRHLRAAGVPYILAPNGTAPRLERRLLAKRLFDAWAGRELLDGAACVLAVTDAERRQLRALGIRNDAIRMVSNPVEIPSPELTQSGRRRDRAPVVAYLGKLTPRKRVDVLIRAFAALRSESPQFAQARLLIAGNDMGAGSDARALVNALGLDAYVEFAGLLRGHARFEFLASADVVVYPSQDEIFGLVPLEALLSGTPVVVTDDSGCGEVVTRVGGGLAVPVGDVGALASAIERLTHCADTGFDVARAAQRVRELFAPDVISRQIEAVYRDVICAAKERVRGQALSGLRSATPRMLAVIPAHNEASNLTCVVADLRAHHPAMEILIVNDGSSDETARLLPRLGVRWLSWKHRRGIGAAIRAGLGYASRAGFDLVVRVDADGQHGADDIDDVVRPILEGRAEVVLGSRYTTDRPANRILTLLQWMLDGCLSTITRRRVTDATSGFCALGPRAIDVLAEHHPTGYPEPELRLFLSRNALQVVEVPVRSRTRLSGRTSLTPGRVAAAAARVLLAMLIVPIRPTVQPPGD